MRILRQLCSVLLLALLAGSCSSSDNGKKTDLGIADTGVTDLSTTDKQAPVETVHLLFKNANIITMNETQPSAEAIYIVGDRIEAVGSTAEIEGTIDPETTIIDLNGKTVVPGFIDGHVHVLDTGRIMGFLDLRPTTEKSEIVQMIKEEIEQKGMGQIVVGFGWDQEKWAVKEFPCKQDLDPISPSNMVVLIRVDGSVMWVNSLVLNLLAINENTPDPEGGKIVRDPVTGEPTGILIGTAMKAVTNLAGSSALGGEQILEVDKAFSAWGLTTVSDAAIPYPAGDGGLDIVKIYKDLVDSNKLKTRVSLAISHPGDAAEAYLEQGPEIGYGNNRLTIRAIKFWADGGLSSRTAALFEDYNDDPGNKGLLYIDAAKASVVMDQALKKGFQVRTHAIGDRAIKTVMDIYEQVLQDNPQATDHRFRIEHATAPRQEDIVRMAENKIIASMQPIWIYATAWYSERLGPERMKLTFALKSMLDAGVQVGGASDGPTEQSDPLRGIFSAVTRQNQKGEPPEGWNPQEKISPMQALRMFTIDAAYGLFEEEIKGSLEQGKLADLVVLSKDILTIPPAEILTTEVEMTVVGGEIVYEK